MEYQPQQVSPSNSKLFDISEAPKQKEYRKPHYNRQSTMRPSSEKQDAFEWLSEPPLQLERRNDDN